jgi:hypothetical protein
MYHTGQTRTYWRDVNYVNSLIYDHSGSPHSDNECAHVRCEVPFSGPYASYTSGRTSVLNQYIGYQDAVTARLILNYVLNEFLSDFYWNLSFQKDDSFEILNFLFEVDEVFVFFSKKFWKDISYGAVNWGLLPFYSDLMSMWNTLSGLYSKQVFKDLSSVSGRRISRRYDLSGMAGYLKAINRNYLFYNSQIRLRGRATRVDPIDDSTTALLILLDELGFHPDLKTLWDLIPLSFLVDYILPVGDVLESLHPRGWFNPTIVFDGFATIYGRYDMSLPLSQNYNILSEGNSRYHGYIRKPVILQTASRKPVEVVFKAPSYRKLFNAAYVGRSLIGGKSRRKS